MPFVKPLVFFLVAVGLLLGGILSGQPALLLSYICLSPLLFIAVGVTAAGAFRGRRLAVLSVNEHEAVKNHRRPAKA